MKKITKAILKKRERRAKKRIKVNAQKEWVRRVKERDNYTCQISGKYLKDAKPQSLQAAHILSKENYPELSTNIMNGISLSFYHHKNSPISSHHDGFAFTLWLMKNKPDQYRYLKDYLEYNSII